MEKREIARPSPHGMRLAFILVTNWIGLVDFLGPQLVQEFCLISNNSSSVKWESGYNQIYLSIVI